MHYLASRGKKLWILFYRRGWQTCCKGLDSILGFVGIQSVITPQLCCCRHRQEWAWLGSTKTILTKTSGKLIQPVAIVFANPCLWHQEAKVYVRNSRGGGMSCGAIFFKILGLQCGEWSTEDGECRKWDRPQWSEGDGGKGADVGSILN